MKNKLKKNVAAQEVALESILSLVNILLIQPKATSSFENIIHKIFNIVEDLIHLQLFCFCLVVGSFNIF